MYDASVNVARLAQPARGGAQAFAEDARRLRVDGRRALRRQHDAAELRGLQEGSRVAVRDLEARPSSTTSRTTGACTGSTPWRLRFGNVYGPRQDPHGEAGVVAIFCGRILAGTRADDLRRRTADARLRVRRRRGRGDLVARRRSRCRRSDCSTHARSTSARGSARRSSTWRTSSSRKPGRRCRSSSRRSGRARRRIRSSTSARPSELLGWRPRVTLREGLANSFRWAAERHAARRSALAHDRTSFRRRARSRRRRRS